MDKFQLTKMPTNILGSDLASALDTKRKEIPENKIRCTTCHRYHSGVFYCEFCLANELYTRRKSMAFMKLDLCVQSAVCLIAKVANQPSLRESKILDVGYSKVFNESYIVLDKPIGDDND